jgi:aminodeoxyfutalosine synthase
MSITQPNIAEKYYNHPMSFRRIEKKLISGKRLSPQDAVELYRSDDIFGLGLLADARARELNGDRVYFVRNRHINPTNICINRCRFCAFSRSRGEDGAYEMTLDDILRRASECGPDTRELHIVGGLHPDWPFSFYTDMLSGIKSRFPHLHIKAFTAVEIDYLTKLSGLGLRKAINALINAGLGSMPGGGAEILGRGVRRKICPEKVSGARWIEVMRAAHSVGLKTNATMLYGHVETIEDRVDHMLRLRELQDETGGFNAFIPLAYQPENTRMDGGARTSAFDDLKTIAVARLFLDNFQHIKAYWVMLGVKIAQIALSFGADDMDGTVIEEKIAHMAGGSSPEAMEIGALADLIRRAGKTPVERNAMYDVVKAYE